MWWSGYIGAPFVDGGRGPLEFDCWGLVRTIYSRHLGIDLPTYGEISARDLVGLAREFKRGADADNWAVPAIPDQFDVVLMRRDRSVIHVGVMTDLRHVLHTEKATGAVRVPIAHVSVAGRIAGYRRWAG